MKKNNRGEVLTGLLIGITLLLGGTQLVPNWRISNLWKPKPPTKELVQAQADLEKAKREASDAASALKAVKDAEAQKTKDQLIYSQQMVAGIPPALAKEPPSAGVTLATSLALRANTGLASAIGELSPTKQEEILRIVEQALSDQAEQIAAANKALAAKDTALAATTAEKKLLEARLPALESKLSRSEALVEAKSATVVQTTVKLTQYAQKAYEKEQEAGSLSALVSQLGRSCAVLLVIVVLLTCAWLYVRVTFGGVPQAIGKGLSEIRAKHPDVADSITQILDANLNRGEQAMIAKHAQT